MIYTGRVHSGELLLHGPDRYTAGHLTTLHTPHTVCQNEEVVVVFVEGKDGVLVVVPASLVC